MRLFIKMIKAGRQTPQQAVYQLISSPPIDMIPSANDSLCAQGPMTEIHDYLFHYNNMKSSLL